MAERKPHFYEWSPQEFRLEMLGNTRTHTLSFCLITSFSFQKIFFTFSEYEEKESNTASSIFLKIIWIRNAEVG